MNRKRRVGSSRPATRRRREAPERRAADQAAIDGQPEPTYSDREAQASRPAQLYDGGPWNPDAAL
jgi:hypothetical protein